MMFFPRNASNKHRNMLFGSSRLHYNWGSSHYYVPAPDQDSLSNSAEFLNDDGDRESKLSGYLEWLEEKVIEDNYIDGGEENVEKDIDRLADKFIASCHEKFLLEKVESDRRFQEMMARSL
ncbi:PREDICTED: uncharacterized protein LOC104824607 [Tarenaya hassleriana]|uniref:uncharacterized protein LOC104824607 n=1 Tax=Tarenaya hassleriana TaxID=28532 RepID=UPI00053C0E0E|nr:PREDICTED: uncharacterized protein LOC104824607 [Tarenaya hassleriana]